MSHRIWWLGTSSEPSFDISLGGAIWPSVSVQWHNTFGHIPTDVSSPYPSKKWWRMTSLFSEILSMIEFSQLDLLLAPRSQKKLDLHLYRQKGYVCVYKPFSHPSSQIAWLFFSLVHMALRCQLSAKSWRLVQAHFG